MRSREIISGGLISAALIAGCGSSESIADHEELPVQETQHLEFGNPIGNFTIARCDELPDAWARQFDNPDEPPREDEPTSTVAIVGEVDQNGRPTKLDIGATALKLDVGEYEVVTSDTPEGESYILDLSERGMVYELPLDSTGRPYDVVFTAKRDLGLFDSNPEKDLVLFEITCSPKGKTTGLHEA